MFIQMSVVVIIIPKEKTNSKQWKTPMENVNLIKTSNDVDVWFLALREHIRTHETFTVYQ